MRPPLGTPARCCCARLSSCARAAAAPLVRCWGLVRWGLGGRNGDGRQYVSWIHDQDFVRAVQWILDHPCLEGVVNVAAPHPLPNAQFMQNLRAAWGTGVGLPATWWMLEVGAWVLRTETELILKSRRAVPTRLLNSGFAFEFPGWPEAAADLCRRWRKTYGRGATEAAA